VVASVAEAETVRRQAAQRARRRYRSFVGRSPDESFDVANPDLSSVAALGTLKELTYASDKWDGRKRLYVHTFDKKTPVVLACSGDGKYLVAFQARAVPGVIVHAEGITG
jgi:hypothetical protein